mgnify:FL=1
MKVIPHTDEMIERSFEKSSRLGSLNNSILRGKGNAAGYMGEEAVAAYLGANIVSNDQYGYDLLKGGRKIEVKTKRRTVSPTGRYEVSVAATSSHQKPDLYAFVSLQFNRSGKVNNRRAYGDLESVWLLGYKNPEDYFREAQVWKPGDIDPDNNFETIVEMFNLPIHKLDTVQERDVMRYRAFVYDILGLGLGERVYDYGK